MKWKSFLLSFIALFFVASTVQAATPISLVINGNTAKTDSAPFIQKGTTYVPLRSIEQIEGIIIKSWNNKTKTLVVADPTQQMTFRVSNQNEPGSPLIKNNRVMVPIRFIAENFNSDVAWNSTTKTVHIAKINDKTKADLGSTDLTTARVASINIPKISTLKELTPGGSSAGSFQLLFPEGQSDSFFTIENGIINYYEVKSNATWLTWSGKMGGSKNIISFLPNTGISSEVGQRPKTNDRLFFYNISAHSGQSQYGYISTNGKETILGSKDMDSLNDLYPIEVEN
ncbi:copper amine oxidase N-terminal domain-containing protein [Paenibacillus sp. Marseille-Q4541]|uniref:copper amine oxidase N-terminal domain-containing protein n=1 Tax=Paenibacillus sp. Marseille-Q4541 TaxID=2831522 RepID=UPI001BA8CEE7|nr:copper amine oxidase N-terminal domain-containing protein [Paenibacillus sp. Marseille-Q4541]